MKVGIIWKNDYPWDVRVEKIAQALRSDGHDVYILSANSRGRKRSESLDGIEIRRLPATPSRWLNALVSIPFYLNPFWIHLGHRVVGRERIDLLIVRDLPLILVGLWLKRRFRIPLVLDMAEDYAAMYRETLDLGGWRAWVNLILKNPMLMALVERRTLRHVDHTFVVVEESAKRLQEQHGLPEARISVVSNTPRLENFGPITLSPKRRPGSSLQLVYAGLVQEARGLEVLVEALRLLRSRGLQVSCRIVGDGPYLPRLTHLVSAKGVQAAITFIGWVAHAEVARHVDESDIGVIPHPKNDHTDTTVPNKLFDYMACGKPVLVSNAAPLERIVNSEHCGLAFTAGSAQSLADAVETMDADPAAFEAMGRNGASAIRRRFHWAHDERVLLHALAPLTRR